MTNRKRTSRLPVNVHEALAAIATTGKGRCWYCDARLPDAARAIDEGWDVQRIDQHPVASIILVCPACVREDALRTVHVQARGPDPATAGNRHPSHNGNGHGRPTLSLQPKRA